MKNSDFFDKTTSILELKQFTNFHAVKNLVEAEHNLKTAQNRVKVLQLNEEKNKHKIQHQIHLISKITQIRQGHQRQVQSLKIASQEQDEHREQLKRANIQKNNLQKSKLTLVFNEMSRDKRQGYLKVCKDQEHGNEKIKQSRIAFYEEKASKRNKVLNKEEQIRQNLLKYSENKMISIYSNNRREIEMINHKKMMKDQQLKDVTNIQMEMIRKQSESQAAYLEVKKKLDSMLNTVKVEKNRCLKTLKPSIHVDKKQRQNTEFL